MCVYKGLRGFVVSVFPMCDLSHATSCGDVDKLGTSVISVSVCGWVGSIGWAELGLRGFVLALGFVRELRVLFIVLMSTSLLLLVYSLVLTIDLISLMMVVWLSSSLLIFYLFWASLLWLPNHAFGITTGIGIGTWFWLWMFTYSLPFLFGYITVFQGLSWGARKERKWTIWFGHYILWKR